MISRHDLAGILLAAGRSRRFGSDKLLHPLPGGTPMALASAAALRAAVPRMVAVIRKDNEALTALFAAWRIPTAVADQADSGMGASLAAGVAASANASGWLIALADMPFIQPHTIARVADALRRGAGMAAPSYEGQRGHPVGFSGAYLDELLKLQGDEGARAVIRRHAHGLVLVECNDPGVLVDIDRPTG